jgi:hypothetical protein
MCADNIEQATNKFKVRASVCRLKTAAVACLTENVRDACDRTGLRICSFLYRKWERLMMYCQTSRRGRSMTHMVRRG